MLMRELLPERDTSCGAARSSRGRNVLAREIAIVLAIKCVALLVIWAIWFAHPEAHRVDGASIRTLFGVTPARLPDRSVNDAGS